MMGAEKVLGLKPEAFMVNGIQIKKTPPHQFRRIFTYREESDYAELKSAVMFNVHKYLECAVKSEFPMSTPGACCMWGGCMYHNICSSNSAVRQNVIQTYKKESPCLN
jgi:hypothetical protein